MGVIRIEGLEELQKKLKKNANMDDVKKVVRHNGSQLQQKIQSNADFKKGYQTGTTKRSVGLEITGGGLTAESGPTTDYAEYLELLHFQFISQLCVLTLRRSVSSTKLTQLLTI